jgi:DNA-binding beta-propeller fold protein YncE
VLLDAHSGHATWRIPIPGHARHLALAGPGGPLLIPSETTHRLLELDLRSRRLTKVIVGAHPHDVAQVTDRTFVTNEFGHSVSAIEQASIIRRIGGFVQPGGITAVGHDVAVVDVGANRLTLIDAYTLQRVGTASAGAGPTHAVADPAGYIYVADTRGNAIEVFTSHPRLRLRTRRALAGTPYGVAIDAARARLWVTLTATNQLAELAITGGSPRLLALYPTGRQPNTVAVDPLTGTAFVADAAEGAIQIIGPRRSRAPAAKQQPT